VKNVIKRIIKDFQNLDYPKVYERTLEVPFHLNKIISIIGPRRSGKTFYLFQLMIKLEQMGVKRSQLLYINFEDERLDIEGKYDYIIESYHELYPELELSQSYFFFDEIQELNNWEKYVRRLYDSISKNIFITGSSSRLLSQEIATSLRGRSLPFEILPLSFNEFLLFQDIDTTDIYSIKNSSIIQNSFNKYIKWGGYPELVHMDDRFKVRTLQEYFNVMIYRDLIERYEIKSVHIIKYILKRLISSFTKEFSVNKIFNEIKSKGISISKTSLYQMIDQIFSIYMLAVIEKYDLSVVKREMSNRKIYLYDTGLTSVTESSLTDDSGKILENIVFSHILRMNAQVYFIKNAWECDFVLFHQNPEKITAIQVTRTLNHMNLKRELKGLDAAKKRLSVCETLLLYQELDPSVSLPDGLKHQSIWTWLLKI
jgi:hypothetical protein